MSLSKATSLIATHYRRPELLAAYLQALGRYHENLEIIVVDIAPEQPCKEATVTLREANYSQAINAGLRLATREYVVWGNEDIEVHGPFIDRLLAPVAEDPHTIAGPNVGYQQGWRFAVGWLVGMHRCALDDIGYLDERFPGTFEDTDYGVRATQAGYRIVRTPLPVKHISLSRLNAHLFTGLHLFLDKHGKGPGRQ